MTKKDLTELLEKFDDENEIYFQDIDSSNFLELKSVEESAIDYIITLNFKIE